MHVESSGAVPEQPVVGPAAARQHRPVETHRYQSHLTTVGVARESEIDVAFGHVGERERIVEQQQPEQLLIEVNLKGKLLRLLSSRAIRRHDENLATILGELVSVQAVIAELDKKRRDEGRERIRGAVEHSGWHWPFRPVTVNLAPAAARKEGAGLDLPIALAVMVAAAILGFAEYCSRA